MASALRAAIYTRISQDIKGTGLGVARQEKDCRALAADRRWQVAEVYSDNDLSASKRKIRRPEYERLLGDITARRLDAVLVWDLDRLHRQPRELEDFVDVCLHAGMSTLATVSGTVDMGTGDGLLVARIKGAVAAEEARKIAQRTARKMRELAEAGRPGGGRRPIGFAPNKIDHDPREKRALRKAARSILDGGTLYAAAKPLSRAGILSERPDSAAKTLRRILLSPRVAGLRQYRGEVIAPAVWEPIIDRADWERLRAILTKGAPPVPHARHLLTGFARCTCGSKLSAQIRKYEGGRVIYACRSARGGCGHVGVDGGRLEAHVVAEVGAWLRSVRVRRAMQRRIDGTDGQEAELLAALAADELRLTELAAEVGRLSITTGEWSAMRQPILDRIEAARADLARLPRRSRVKVSLDDVAAMWVGADFVQRRAVLRAMGVTVTVAPVGKTARRFQPGRVTVEPSWATMASTST